MGKFLEFTITNDGLYELKGDALYKTEGNLQFKLYNVMQDHKVYPTYTRVPDGVYRPKDLGLDLPACSRISIGYCPDNSKWKKRWNWSKWKFEDILVHTGKIRYELAHAHDTQICIFDGRYVFRDKGVPDDVVWHEYAHILAGCDKHGHDYVWAHNARKLGIANPQPMTNYDYYGEPQVVWGT